MLAGCAGGTGISKNAATLTLGSSTLDFGSVAANTSKTLSFSLVSSSSNSATAHVSQVSVTGSGFVLSSPPAMPMSITPGQTVNINLKFTPTSAGALTGTVTITSDAASPTLMLALTGTGTTSGGGGSGQLTANPTTQSFGSVAVGSPKNLTGSLAASGASVQVTSASWNGPGFSVSGITFPVTINAGQSVSYTVTFAPTTAGPANGNISFVSNAANTLPAVTLSGTGTQGASHSVTLSWTASTSTVAGYRVYRGTSSGGPYTIQTPSPIGAASFTDATVASGNIYFYVTTAVDANSVESDLSNEAQVTVP